MCRLCIEPRITYIQISSKLTGKGNSSVLVNQSHIDLSKMGSIWQQQIIRIDERQAELEQAASALARERIRLVHLLNSGFPEYHRSIRVRQEVLHQRQFALMEAIEEHRRTIHRIIEEIMSELDTESGESGTDDTDTATDSDEC